MLYMRWLLMLLTVFSLPVNAGVKQDKSKKTTGPVVAGIATKNVTKRDNPFFHISPLPFQAPQFDKIKDSDYQIAIEQGMKQQLAEVSKIANNPSPPNIENTFVALEKSGRLLNRVLAVFNGVTAANNNSVLQKLQKTEAPRLAAHRDAILLNKKLFQRITKVYDARNKLKLDAQSRRLIDVIYREFVHRGAQLSDADKTRLKVLNRQISVLTTQFTNKLLAANKVDALWINAQSKLDGLSHARINRAAQAAKTRGLDGTWLLVLQNTTQQPALRELHDRATRKALFEASWNRAEKGGRDDTRDTIERIAQLRARKAKLLGFPNYAAWRLVDQMAKNPATVMRFLDQLTPAAVARAKVEAANIQKQIDKDQARLHQASFPLKAWDWLFYAQQERELRYKWNETQTRPYFVLDNVLTKGVFYAAHQLYGLTFRENKTLPVYQPDVRVFEVFDKNGQLLALYYGDYFKRDNKNGGAWTGSFVTQSKLLDSMPVIYNVTNFAKPMPGQPALLSFDDVITLFHEFGHALHGMFADVRYPTLSGTNVARDFVEFPSQFNEYWATDPDVLAHYVIHDKTRQTRPRALLKKLEKASLFNRGYDMTERVAAALLDMHWHMLGASAPKQQADSFETRLLRKDGVALDYVPPRYRSSYFLHIWSGGYAAGYYAYLWTEMLADDAFTYFKKHGGLTRANGDRFRKMVLSRGNSEDPVALYRHWRGRNPDMTSIFKY